MHPEFDIGDCGTGTYETYETNVTYGTGTWDWDYGTLALGFAGLFDRKITSSQTENSSISYSKPM